MNRQRILFVIIAIAGLLVGLACGFLISKSKANKNKAIIADLQSTMAKSETLWQERVQKSDAEVVRLNNELSQAKTELDQLKGPGTVTTTTAENTAVSGAATSSADTAQKGKTAVYTVKPGDSLWQIAANQLGDGNRFKEIIKLNPRIANTKNLAVGTRLTLPAK